MSISDILQRYRGNVKSIFPTIYSYFSSVWLEIIDYTLQYRIAFYICLLVYT